MRKVNVRWVCCNNQDDPLLTEALYRNKESLETIFRVIDKDHSGIP